MKKPVGFPSADLPADGGMVKSFDFFDATSVPLDSTPTVFPDLVAGDMNIMDGGRDTRGVNELIDDDIRPLGEVDNWSRSNGYVLVDDNRDGVFDRAYDPSTSTESLDGVTWRDSERDWASEWLDAELRRMQELQRLQKDTKSI